MNRLRATLPAILAVAVVASDAAAQRRVTGVVSAADGGPLSAASIQIVGTTTGTYSNETGRFSLSVPDGPTTLRVRRIGYRQRTVTLTAGQTEVNVTLEKDVLQLEAQVVTGTATSISKANAANAISTVSAEELVGRAPAQSIDNALQGKVAGAVISTNSGAPGGGSQVQLRGVSSINASSSPLYVVDGVLVSNQSFGNGLNSLTSAGAGISASQDQAANRIADLNPQDIESIEVLKGPSAGAIYGSKAANGVIVIRTKRGQNGKPAFNFIQRVGTFQLQKERKLDLRCFTEAEALDYEGVTKASDLASGGFFGCNDPQDSFYKADSPSYQTSLGVRGGTAGGTTYFVSGLLQRDNAIQKGTYYGKQSITGNIGQTVGSRLTIQANNNFLHTLTDRGISGNDNSPVVSPVSVFSNTPTYFDFTKRDPGTGQYIPNPYLNGAGSTNPFQTAELVKLPQDVFRYVGSVNLTYNALATDKQTFDVTVLGGVDAFSQNNKIYSPPTVYFEPTDGFPGMIVNGDITSQYANFNASGVHRLTLSPLTATTSFGVRREYRNSDNVINRARNVPLGAQNILISGTRDVDEARFRVHDLGVFVQEEILTLGERLSLTGAINSERSSTNGDNKKFYAFPKASASYRLPFLPPFTDELKLRRRVRQGRQPGAVRLLVHRARDRRVRRDARRPPVADAGLADIKPETSTELEGGADLSFFKGRMALSATMFRTNVEDLILLSAPATSTGFSNEHHQRRRDVQDGLGVRALGDAVPGQVGAVDVAHDLLELQQPRDATGRAAVHGLAVVLAALRRRVGREGPLDHDGPRRHQPRHLGRHGVRLPRERARLPDGLLERRHRRTAPPLRPARLAQGWWRGQPDEQLLRRDQPAGRHRARRASQRRLREGRSGVLREGDVREAARDQPVVRAAHQVLAAGARRPRAGPAPGAVGTQPVHVGPVHGLRPGGLELQRPEPRPLPGRDPVSAEPELLLLGVRELLSPLSRRRRFGRRLTSQRLSRCDITSRRGGCPSPRRASWPRASSPARKPPRFPT